MAGLRLEWDSYPSWGSFLADPLPQCYEGGPSRQPHKNKSQSAANFSGMNWRVVYERQANQDMKDWQTGLADIGIDDRSQHGAMEGIPRPMLRLRELLDSEADVKSADDLLLAQPLADIVCSNAVVVNVVLPVVQYLQVLVDAENSRRETFNETAQPNEKLGKISLGWRSELTSSGPSCSAYSLIYRTLIRGRRDPIGRADLRVGRPLRRTTDSPFGPARNESCGLPRWRRVPSGNRGQVPDSVLL